MRHNILALSLVTLTACGSAANLSRVEVTDVDHTSVKRQSIGNCWIYAVATWVESLHKIATDEEVNVSESYWTYWHFYDQLVNGYVGKEIETGGSFFEAVRLIREHGITLEETFIPEEADREKSERQARAETSINKALSEGGELETAADRTPKKIRAFLDKAFGAHMRETERQAIEAADFTVTTDPHTGGSDTLENVIGTWRVVDYPQLRGETAVESRQLHAKRNVIMRRAQAALNAHFPVMISIEIDFNGLDTEDGNFKGALLRESPIGTQGGHMTVLEDYAVDEVPGVGSLEEGDLSDDLKELALQGEVRYLKAKNSWGTNRPERGITDGYTRFDAAYMNDAYPFGKTLETASWHSPLSDFLLPPGW